MGCGAGRRPPADRYVTTPGFRRTCRKRRPYGVAYGFGWRVSGDSLWDSGESIGFRNVLVRYPGQRLTVIILRNRGDPEPRDTATAIARLFLDR